MVILGGWVFLMSEVPLWVSACHRGRGCLAIEVSAYCTIGEHLVNVKPHANRQLQWKSNSRSVYLFAKLTDLVEKMTVINLGGSSGLWSPSRERGNQSTNPKWMYLRGLSELTLGAS